MSFLNALVRPVVRASCLMAMLLVSYGPPPCLATDASDKPGDVGPPAPKAPVDDGAATAEKPGPGGVADGQTNAPAGNLLGACCSDFGNCAEVEEAACLAGGGRFGGVGTGCFPNPCFGACCFGASCNNNQSSGHCRIQGGAYQGDGTDCTDGTIACPPSTGACCIADACSDVTPTDCTAGGGTFMGLGVQCFRVSCSPPEVLGACCLNDGCGETTLADCVAAGGNHRGEGTRCEDQTCTGACCNHGDCQNNFSSFFCGVDGGAFQGIGTTCADAGIACPLGACCFQEGSCDTVTETSCLDFGGIFNGVGTSCADAVCTGACCQDGGFCEDTVADNCHGTFQGLGTTCDTAVCEFGACCDHGSCEMTTETSCLNRGEEAVFNGVGTNCADTVCTGACCAFSSSSCINLPDATSCREQFDGVFQGIGTTCTDPHIACPSELGACCVRHGGDPSAFAAPPQESVQNCLNTTEFECAFQGGDFVAGSDCNAAACPLTQCPGLGDCCLDHRSGGCVDATCCQTVCAADPFCCFASWDDACIDLANRLCGDGQGGFCAQTLSDLNGDGVVDLLDYGLFQRAFRRSAP